MNNSISVLKNLEHSLKSNVFDYQLFYKLQNSIKTIDVISNNSKQYTQLMINVYELSNIQTLFTIRKNSITGNQIAYHLKLLTCQMICQIILYYDKQSQAYEFPLNVLAQALQIMITTVRICLNQGSKYVSKIIQFYKLINGPFQYTYSNISHQTKFIHYLNVLQIKKYKFQQDSFDTLEFENRLRHLYQFKQIQSAEYLEYIQYLTIQILLKSLKSGQLNIQSISNFQSYLSKQYYQMLKNACEFNEKDSMNLIQSEGSQFFQLYFQIRNQGIKNISLDYLEQFIKKNENFTNSSIFDIAALTLEPTVLQIWFHVHNSMKENIQIIGQAYKCFIYLIDKIDVKKQQNQLQKQFKQDSYLRLARNLMLSLLTEKKDGKNKNSDPFFQIIKSLINLLIWLIFDQCKNFQKIKDFCQKLILICIKFSCNEICKIIYSIQLYFQLIYGISSKQTYQNFVKQYQNDSSCQIYRILKAAYDFQNTNSSEMKEQNQIILKTKPFLAILFGNQTAYFSILKLDMKEFKQIKCKFSIYLQMIRKLRNNHQHIVEIINHLQQTLILLPIEQTYKQLFENNEGENESLTQKDSENIQFLLQQLAELQKQDFPQNTDLNFKLSFVSVLLCFFSKKYLQLCSKINFGVVLNKFSKFVKISYLICQKIQTCEQKLIVFSQTYLIECLQKFKKQTLRHQKIGQVGQFSFIQSISMLVKQYYNVKFEQVDKKQYELLLFTIFQLDCISNNIESYEKSFYQLPLNLIRMFSQSVYIPIKLKHKYLRRLLRQNILTKEGEVTLNDFKDLIQMSENQEERSLYLKHVISIHGQKGKNMIYLLANTNKSIQNMLSQQNI